eukprot:TRINITY_DN57_c0_g1_i7.p1 TRINITY_DN57_c0_g1~~TRINITY_DN57_c0_g1_i7.p1  ORF type:complete len:525 (-),score=81.89 TRINITY_DN57_c0_g1_i7:23-1597(-)
MKVQKLFQEALQISQNQRERNFRDFILSLMMIYSKPSPSLKKNLDDIKPYLNKCFEGIDNFTMTTPNQEITDIFSSSGEKVELIRCLGVKEGDRKGNVEIWLKDLEKIMIETLQNLCKKSFENYSASSRADWVLQWPNQVVLVIDQIYWTSNVEAGLRDNKIKTLESYNEVLKTQTEQIVELVRGDAEEKINLEALLIQEVHEKEIVQFLVDKKILDESAFEWISQMRYYYEKDDIKVKMMTASLKYGFEYIGNRNRLVITPLTDRCYRTLMMSKHMNKGGALEGPAGTGKTETVKNLAKALGNYCVVFNGSDELDHISMAKFFKGIASAGAWCCFDEFNRIDLEVLSVIASQILMIQQALTIEQSVFHFLDEEITLNSQCAINITMNPGNISKTDLPDNLKALFRPCAMTTPDYFLIAETLLCSYGFQQAKELAQKIVGVLRLCNEQLSAQEHYDFGMRALTAILMTAKILRKKIPSEMEDQIARRALDESNLPKLTNQDIVCLLYTSPSPRDLSTSRMPSSA